MPLPPLHARPPGSDDLRLRLSLLNDNWGSVIPALDGAGHVVFGADRSAASGNDLGYTAGLALDAEWQSGTTVISAGVASDLFTRDAGESYVRADGRQVMVTDAVDLTAVSLSLARPAGRWVTPRVGGELGLRNSRLLMNLQNAWHGMIPAAYLAEHRAAPATIYGGVTVGVALGERLSLGVANATLGFTSEIGAHASTAVGASHGYASLGVSATLGRLSLSAGHEERCYAPHRLASETRAGAAVDLGTFSLSLDAMLRRGAFNTPLTQYDDDQDLLLRVGLGF